MSIENILSPFLFLCFKTFRTCSAIRLSVFFVKQNRDGIIVEKRNLLLLQTDSLMFHVFLISFLFLSKYF